VKTLDVGKRSNWIGAAGVLAFELEKAPTNTHRFVQPQPRRPHLPPLLHPLCHLVAAMANALNQIYRYAIPTAVAFSLASASIYDVKGGTRAVIFDRLRGVSDQVVNEGTHFLVPWLQKAVTFDVRTKPRNISTTTGSKDLQMVSLTLRVLHRPEVGMLPKIYQVRCPLY
jgi:hypothetical protein